MNLAVLLLAASFAVAGAVLVVLSAIGVLRLPDPYLRCHAAGKAATLGVIFVLLAAAMLLGGGAWLRVFMAAAFLIGTVPVATQLLAHGAVASGIAPASETSEDRSPIAKAESPHSG